MRTTKRARAGKPDMIKCIDNIARASEGSRFNLEFSPARIKDLDIIEQYFSITREQAVLFSVIFILNLEKESVSIKMIAEYLRCSIIKVLVQGDDLTALEKTCLIRREQSQQRMNKCAFNRYNYYIPLKTIERINNGKKMSDPDERPETIVEVLSEFNNLLNDRTDGIMNDEEFITEAMQLMKSADHLGLVSYLLNSRMEKSEIMLFLYLCHRTLFDDPEVNFRRALEELFQNEHLRYILRITIIRKTATLVRLDLVKLETSTFISDKYIMLTESALEWLYGEDYKLIHKESSQANYIKAGNIVEKRLYFRTEETKKIDELVMMLQEDNFSRIRERMKEKGLRAGMTIFLHGKPGTGKTETVYQVARKTERDIILVDISQSKSMWYGESEKITKKIFDNYRKTMERSKTAPILLFNEADGIFGSRRELGNSAVDQTSNTIQNIILQEMENFEGILIATTNLTSNFDKAFERRFLYKIRFDEPTLEARVSIWKDKLPGLEENIIGVLAGNFQMTGGQIDNIARKYLMKHITEGAEASLPDLEMWCRDEALNKNIRSIGYK
jgi:hypothetical protein